MRDFSAAGNVGGEPVQPLEKPLKEPQRKPFGVTKRIAVFFSKWEPLKFSVHVADYITKSEPDGDVEN